MIRDSGLLFWTMHAYPVHTENPSLLSSMKLNAGQMFKTRAYTRATEIPERNFREFPGIPLFSNARGNSREFSTFNFLILGRYNFTI